jgi:hypothetical protein
MAPEQWTDAASADARADQYALATLAWECLKGRPPFAGRDRLQLARAHAREPIPPLGEAFPRELDAVLGRALAKRQHERFPSVLAFGAAFREATGVGAPEDLPRLDGALRAAVIGFAPQPIAEAVAALDGARNLHEARDALWEVVAAVVRTLGVVALAARSRTGSGSPDAADSPVVTAHLRALRRHGLSEEEWVELARELCRPFARIREAHPVPELVALFFPGEAAAPLERLAAERSPGHSASTTDDDLRTKVARLLPELEALLRSVAFLSDYPLVVGDELWMGTRRRPRPRVTNLRALPAGEPVLLDGDGRPVLALSPLVVAAPPSPGEPPELFFLEGPARRGARLVAHPARFEHADERPWEWLRAQGIGADTADRDHARDEAAPWRGLASFHKDDAALFFGRERQVEAVVNRLRAVSLVAVVGPSGAGKSSFAHAGVAPALQDHTTVSVRPGAMPTAALAAALEREHIDPVAPARLGPVLLIVDQLEELFTLCLDEEERDPLRRIRRAARGDARGEGRAHVARGLPRARGLAALPVTRARDPAHPRPRRSAGSGDRAAPRGARR